MLIAVVVLSAVYPYFGYMRRFVDGDLERNREQIMRVLESQHMKLDHITPGRLTFRADNIFRRLSLLFEDHIKVVQEDDGRLAISGNRKIVAYVVYLLSSAIKTANRECEESE